MKRAAIRLAVLVLFWSLVPSLWAAEGAAGAAAAAKPKEAALDLGGGVKLELVWVPGGSFTMGSRASAEDLAKRYGGKAESYADEHPAHEVALDGFWMGKYEVTNAQFRRFRPDHDSGSFMNESLNGDSQPVVMVSWEDATAFCQWLSGKSGKTIALPSEARWEYACRAVTKTEWSWGDDEASIGRYANVADRAFAKKWPDLVEPMKQAFPGYAVAEVDDGHAMAAPVGSYRPNAFGLYDMIGNVLEWCQDWHHDSYAGAPTDGSAWESPAGRSRVVRGGSWGLDPGRGRAADRRWSSPVFRSSTCGFRVWTAEGAAGTTTTLGKAGATVAAKPKETTLDLGGRVKLTLVWVPGGTFTMGSRASGEDLAKRYGGCYGGKAEDYADEHPAHEVALDGFWMGKYEVTNAQFRRFRPNHNSGSMEGESLNRDSQPVVSVRWDDAKAFCQWLSKKSGKTIALPSEAQWEYACRAGTTTDRYWGDDDASMGRYANVPDRALARKWPKVLPLVVEGLGVHPEYVLAFTEDGYAVTAPVGSYRPNAFGLYDMIGNAYEWCQDYYGKAYYSSSAGRNPTGPETGQWRVVRGGSWDIYPRFCRAADRFRLGPPGTHDYYGFRVMASRMN